MCVCVVETTHADFNLFELQTSKLKMKFSDVQSENKKKRGGVSQGMGQDIGATYPSV